MCPINLAARSNQIDVMKELIKRGADVHAMNYWNETAIQMARGDECKKIYLTDGNSYHKLTSFYICTNFFIYFATVLGNHARIHIATTPAPLAVYVRSPSIIFFMVLMILTTDSIQMCRLKLSIS